MNRSNDKSFHVGYGGRWLVLLVTVALVARSAQAQAPEADRENQPITPSTGIGDAAAESVWRFGLAIDVDNRAEGIVATTPVPIECPEQDVELIGKTLGDGVRGVKLKKLKPMARQMVFKVSALQPGQSGQTTVAFRVTKRAIAAPVDPDAFVFAVKPRGKLKAFLGTSPYIESDDDRIVEIAQALADSHADKTAWEQVEAIYRWVRENVTYKFDTKIQTCIEALDTKTGDCEELSSLFIAICRARDIPARAVWVPGHTYPEFYLEDRDGKGRWFPCQAAGSWQFGEMNERRPILQKGDRYKVSGLKGMQRYAQPTLKCKNALGNISIKQIANEVTQQYEQ